MGGERSKRIGDLGENIVERVLSLIGWTNPIRNFDVKCHFNERHERSKNHGMDLLVFQRDFLLDATQDNIVISSKYYDSYPKSSPNGTLKKLIKDVSDAIECIQLNEQFGLNSIDPQLTEPNWVGVIFWLSHGEEPDTGIIEKLTDIRNTEELNYPAIYIVDNKRVNFLIRTIHFARTMYLGEKTEVQFVYPNTGMNITGFKRVTSGSRLPVQFINSNILPMKVIRNSGGVSEEILLLSILDEFDSTTFKRVLGLAQNMTENWATKIVICFPDYHRLEDEHYVETAMQSFTDKKFVQKVEVDSWNINLRSFEGDQRD